MALDPVTAGLELAREALELIAGMYIELLKAATDEQKARLVEAYLEDRAFWRDLLRRFLPAPAAGDPRPPIIGAGGSVTYPLESIVGIPPGGGAGGAGGSGSAG